MSRTPLQRSPRDEFVRLLIVGALIASAPCALAGEANVAFLRGDANGDGSLNIADAITTLDFLFGGGTVTLPCEDAADANDDGGVNIADAISVLNHLFVAPVPLPDPFGVAGGDPTPDALGCAPFDCTSASELAGVLGLPPGDYTVPNAIPLTTIPAGIQTSLEFGPADVLLTIDDTVYDAATVSILVTGTASAMIPITWTVIGISTSCTLAYEIDGSTEVLFDSIAETPDSTRLVGILSISQFPLSWVPSGCTSIATDIAPFVLDIGDLILATALGALSAQLDVALQSQTVIVCE